MSDRPAITVNITGSTVTGDVVAGDKTTTNVTVSLDLESLGSPEAIYSALAQQGLAPAVLCGRVAEFFRATRGMLLP